MSSIDVEFSRAELAGIRMDARRLGVKVPKHLTALKHEGRLTRVQWLVEGDDRFALEVTADNAYDAKVQAIESLIKAHLRVTATFEETAPAVCCECGKQASIEAAPPVGRSKWYCVPCYQSAVVKEEGME